MLRGTMTVRRLLSIAGIGLATSLSVPGVAGAQPTPDPAPAGDAPPPAEPAEPIEEPPKDMEGTDENPDAPRSGAEASAKVVAAPAKQRTAGYPVEEAYRPITLPQNMSEVSLDPHAQVSPYHGTTTLRARYGITRQVQLGLTYNLGAIYNDQDVDPQLGDKYRVRVGKAVGMDVTVLLQNWIGVRVGVPVYVEPVAVGLTLGAPMRFYLTDKVTIGGLDDVLEIRLHRFAPSFYSEAQNATRAFQDSINTVPSAGALRLAFYGIYQHETKLAFIARVGALLEDFATSRGIDGRGGMATFLRAGVQYTPRRFVDLGFSLGFDDLSRAGSFSPAGLVAFRI